MNRRSIAALLVLCASAGALFGIRTPLARAAEAPPRPTTLILVRHAEKDPKGDPRDPGLSDEGRARSERLAHLLSAASVTHLFATEFHRTQDTLEPLAKACGKPVAVVPGAKTKDLCAALDALPGGAVVVVAGHSNTIPAVAAHYGLTLSGLEPTANGPLLPDAAYDRLYAITLPPKGSPGDWSLLELRY